MMRLTGQSIYDASLAVVPMVNRPWASLPVDAKLKYEQLAQILEVQIGLLEDHVVEYFLCRGKDVTQASTEAGVQTLISAQIELGDFFDMYLFRAGAQVGRGRYQLQEDHSLHEMKCEGEAVGLLPIAARNEVAL